MERPLLYILTFCSLCVKFFLIEMLILSGHSSELF